MSPRSASLCNMRLIALYNNVCVVVAIIFYVTIAPYNSKILCLLLSVGIELSIAMLIVLDIKREEHGGVSPCVDLK